MRGWIVGAGYQIYSRCDQFVVTHYKGSKWAAAPAAHVFYCHLDGSFHPERRCCSQQNDRSITTKPVIEFLRSRRVLIKGALRPACISFENGRIVAIDDYASAPAGTHVMDAGEYCVLPGLVDSHVHVNDPGREHWEGFRAATAAAAAGGCTCIVDMPLNSIPATTTVSALERKREAARNRCLVDYAFWGGVVPGNTDDLMPLAQSGVRGFKCFLADSGVPEFARVSEADLHSAMPVIAETGLPLLVHAELPEPLMAAQMRLQSTRPDWTLHAAHLEARPPEAEIEAVDLMIRLCRKYRCRVHIVHVSAAETLPLLKQARLEGLSLTAETCPHYLYFAAENVPPRATHFKCAPPIRDATNRELLWNALAAGVLDLIATDHSPCPPDLKQLDTGDFNTAWGGIASLSIALPAIWTAARDRGFTLEDIARWMCADPAHLAGLQKQKGQIAAGHDADFVIFDPDARFEVTPNRLHFRHPLSPYLGEKLFGEVLQVFLRGRCIYADAQFAGERLGMELCTVNQWSQG